MDPKTSKQSTHTQSPEAIQKFTNTANISQESNNTNSIKLNGNRKLKLITLFFLSTIFWTFSSVNAFVNSFNLILGTAMLIGGVGYSLLSLPTLLLFFLAPASTCFLAKKRIPQEKYDSKRNLKVIYFIIVLNFINYFIVSSLINLATLAGDQFGIYQFLPFLSLNHVFILIGFILSLIYVLLVFSIFPKIHFTRIVNLILITISIAAILLSYFQVKIILGIFGLLTATIIPLSPLNNQATTKNLPEITDAIETYYHDNKVLPTILTDLDPDKDPNFRTPKIIGDYKYQALSLVTYELCMNLSSDLNTEDYPDNQILRKAIQGKDYQCLIYEIPMRQIYYPDIPNDLHPNYQPMILSGGFWLPQSLRGNHLIEAKVNGENCSGTNGKGGNKITVKFNKEKNRSEFGDDWYPFTNWAIWDTGCGFETGNPVSFTLDGEPAGVAYHDDSENSKKYNVDVSCLPFLANKRMTREAFYTGRLIIIRPLQASSKKQITPYLNCEHVVQLPAYPRPNSKPVPMYKSMYNDKLVDNLYSEFPNRTPEEGDDKKRQNDAFNILNAIGRYLEYNNGDLPEGLPNNARNENFVRISSDEADLCSDLIPDILPYFPQDPSLNNGKNITSCSNYNSGYEISIGSKNNIIIYSKLADKPFKIGE